MKILFLDTETTGLVDFNLDDAHPAQPVPVQIGLEVYTHLGEFVDKKRFTLSEDEVRFIPPEASAIHGITMSDVRKYGQPFSTINSQLNQIVNQCALWVNHNTMFDKRIMKIAFCRFMPSHLNFAFTPLARIPMFCTMKTNTNVLKLPKKTGHGYKYPRLDETYRHYFNRDPKGTHDAVCDAGFSREIFFEMVRRKMIDLNDVLGLTNA